MKVIKKIETPKSFYSRELTLHFNEERQKRFDTYVKRFGIGTPVDTFEVDNGHKHGKENHVLCDNRLIYVFNKKSGRFVTVLYARPQQLKRYYKVYFPQYKYAEYVEGYNEI